MPRRANVCLDPDQGPRVARFLTFPSQKKEDPMPTGDLVVLSMIVTAFLIFMFVLGAVALWSEQTPKSKRHPADVGSQAKISKMVPMDRVRAH